MIIYSKHNLDRKEKFRLITRIEKEGSNFFSSKISRKNESVFFLNSFFEKFDLLKKNSFPFDVVEPISTSKDRIIFEYIEGETLNSVLFKKFKNSDREGFVDLLKKYFDHFKNNQIKNVALTDNFIDIFGGSKNLKFDCINVGCLDLNYDNIIIDNNGKYWLIDYEWTFNFPIPYKYIIFRSLIDFYYKYTHYGINKNFIKLSALYSIFNISDKEKDIFIEFEYNLKKYIYSFEDHFSLDHYKKDVYLLEEFENYDFNGLRKKENQLLIIKNEKDQLVKQLENTESLSNNVLNEKNVLAEEILNVKHNISVVEAEKNVLAEEILNVKQNISLVEAEKRVLTDEILNAKQNISLVEAEKKVLTDEILNAKHNISVVEAEKNVLAEEILNVKHNISVVEAEKNVLAEEIGNQRKEFFEQYILIQDKLIKQVEILNQKDVVIQHKEEEKNNIENQYKILVSEKDVQINNLNTNITSLNKNIINNQQQIALMESSKFWKLRRHYLRIKWAIFNPYRFFKKYTNLIFFSPTIPVVNSTEFKDNDISVIVHLYYTEMWDEIRVRLENMPRAYDLIVSFTEGHYSQNDIEKIKQFNPNSKILVFENKGLDILPFLKSLKLVSKSTKYILKIQPKKSTHTNDIGKPWFDSLMDHVLPDRTSIGAILDTLAGSTVGMIGGSIVSGYDRTFARGEFSEPKLRSGILELLYKYFNEKETNYKWISGTVFWVRFDLISKLTTDSFISFIEQNQPVGYIQNDTIAHGVERYLGKCIYDAGRTIELFPEQKYKKNILFISHDNSLTGAPRVVFEIASEVMKSSIYNVILVCNDVGQSQDGRINELYSVPTVYCDINDNSVIQEIVSRYKPNLIYANTVVSWKWVKYAKENNIPNLFHIHEKKDAISTFGLDCKTFLGSVDGLSTIAVSESVSNDLCSFGLKNTTVLHEFINTDTVDFLKLKEEKLPNGINHKKPIIICVGSIAYRKGSDIFIETARAMPDFQFLCMGRIYDEEILKDIPKNCFYIGQTNNPYYYLSIASLLVLPSREDPFPLVVLEALYLNKPVVSFTEGIGSAELIRRLGFLLPGSVNKNDLIRFIKNFNFNNSDRETSNEIKQYYSNFSQISKIQSLIESKLDLLKDIANDVQFKNKTGVEIGGPSELFTKFFPIYTSASKIDGVNFSEKTLWDVRKAGKGEYSYIENKKGDQYILEATNLVSIKDYSYDFLLSSHNLEHIANPIKAVKEWVRVVKPGSRIVIVVPNKEKCFDHNREYTPFAHVLEDYYRDVSEDDMTHFDEIMDKHDLSMDKAAGTFEQFKERSLDNISNRALHHHVFSVDLIRDIFKFLDVSFEINYLQGIHNICIGITPCTNKKEEENIKQSISIETNLQNSFYMRGKWAIFNPLKFLKKYIWRGIPTYPQISWALRNPGIFVKKYSQARTLAVDESEYGKWIEVVERPFKEKVFIAQHLLVRELKYIPRISILIPTYNSDVVFLKKAIDSVINQYYPYWELCIVDDGSSQAPVKKFLKKLQKKKDQRIKIFFSKEQGGISVATNIAAGMATGEYIALLDHDDEIEPHALLLFVLELQKNPDIDISYSDTDKITIDGKRYDYEFRPDWSPELLLSCCYTTHFNIIRVDLFKKVGGFRTEMNGSQDYDLWLRMTEHTNRILHIPWVLYHWRAVPGSAAVSHNEKPYANDAAIRAISEAINRRDIPGIVDQSFLPGIYKISFDKNKVNDKVSIIIPTKNSVDVLKKCIESIRNLTTYSNYEIVVVDNGSTDHETLEYLKNGNFTVLSLPTLSFNFSYLNNRAVEKVHSKYVIFLNNDTEVINPDWILEMVGTMKIRPLIGVVGAKLLYPDNRIQHAGVITLYREYIATHVMYGIGRDNTGYLNYAQMLRNYSATTGACMMVEKDVFQKIGMFNEVDLKVAYNDIDLCLRLRASGYDCVFNPEVLLYHHESYSRNPEVAPEELAYIRSVWIDDIHSDPFYSPHFMHSPFNDFIINIKNPVDKQNPIFYDVDAKVLQTKTQLSNPVNKNKIGYLYQQALNAYHQDGLRIMIIRIKNYILHGKGRATILNSHNLKSFSNELKKLEKLPEKKIFSVTKKEKPLISIIIPVFNELNFTLQCLKSIAYSNTKNKFEVIVVDDASTDDTHDVLSKRTDIIYLKNKTNQGFIYSCNFGASKARGDFLFFLNNDTVVLEDWLDSSIQIAVNDLSIGLVGSKLIYPDGKLQEAGGVIYKDGHARNYGCQDNPSDPQYNFIRDADYASGAAILVSKKIFQKIGGFDDAYSPAYYEDVDLAFSIRKLGFKTIYNPFSEVIHFEGVSSGTDIKSGVKIYQDRNRNIFKNKWDSVLLNFPEFKYESNSHGTPLINKKRILVIDQLTPTPDQDAGSVYMINTMKILLKLGYKVTFIPCSNLSFVDQYTDDLQKLGIEVVYSPYTNSVEDFLKSRRGGYEIIMLVRAPTAFQFLDIVKLLYPQAKIIFNMIDIHYLREERRAKLENNSLLMKEAIQLKKAELSIISRVDDTIVVSPAEKEIIKAELSDARVDVVHLIRDIPKYVSRKRNQKKCDLVFIGGFNHFPNIDAVEWLCKGIFPIVLERIPHARLHIVGSNVTPAIQSLKSTSIIIHGFLKEKELNYLIDQAVMTVAPIRYGAGQKGKILHSLSRGIPCVTTSIGAEGMNMVHGKDVLVADTIEDFANMICRLNQDETMWQMLSKNGYDLVKKEFGIERGTESIKAIVQSFEHEKNLKIIYDHVKNKEQFRTLCLELLPEIKNKHLPIIVAGRPHEAVLVETRVMPHIEMLIRNAILKLGYSWSFTIVCGDENYEFMKKMCSEISSAIKIINIKKNINSTEDYSQLLTSESFWNMLTGSKVLIYQEDSMIFKNNADSFLKWDYIGAPWVNVPNMDWAAYMNDNFVGNGGLSIRTKSVMIEVIKKYPFEKINKEYFDKNNREKSSGHSIIPEDIYFSYCMSKYSIGKIAPWSEARKFSIEHIDHSDPFGGHCFWHAKTNWQEYLKIKFLDE